jgi:ribonuclease HI
MELGEQ